MFKRKPIKSEEEFVALPYLAALEAYGLGGRESLKASTRESIDTSSIRSITSTILSSSQLSSLNFRGRRYSMGMGRTSKDYGEPYPVVSEDHNELTSRDYNRSPMRRGVMARGRMMRRRSSTN